MLKLVQQLSFDFCTLKHSCYFAQTARPIREGTAAPKSDGESFKQKPALC